MRISIVFIASFVLVYVCFAFVIGDINALNWSAGTRFGYIMFSVLGFIVYYSMDDNLDV